MRSVVRSYVAAIAAAGATLLPAAGRAEAPASEGESGVVLTLDGAGRPCGPDCEVKSARDQGATLLAKGELTPNDSAPTPLVAVEDQSLPEVPAAPGQLREGGAVNLDVEANVLVAYDRARTVEARGKEAPDDAAAAWAAVAAQGGENPFREMAAARSKQWRGFAASKRAFEALQARDSGRLRKILPLGSVADNVKVELLVRFARAYGAEKAAAFLPLVPAQAARARADLAIGCEARDAARCVAAARAADEAKDAKSAVNALDRACGAGASEACTEVGDRLLRTDGRDVTRAVAALQRGCAASSGPSCSRLARVYEQGDGVSIDLAAAAGLREQACAAGDGTSCRRLACNSEGGSPARALELWKKGCASGDSISCLLASAEQGATQPSTAQRAAAAQTGSGLRGQVEEATANAKPAVATGQPTGARPASTAAAPPATGLGSSGPATKAAAPGEAVSAENESSGAQRLGLVLMGTAVVGGAVAFLSAQEPDVRFGRRPHHGRSLVETRAGADGSHTLSLALGAAAALSASAGAVLFFSRSDPAPAKVRLGLAPNGLVLSGSLP